MVSRQLTTSDRKKALTLFQIHLPYLGVILARDQVPSINKTQQAGLDARVNLTRKVCAIDALIKGLPSKIADSGSTLRSKIWRLFSLQILPKRRTK
jgi:hypothetical protein